MSFEEIGAVLIDAEVLDTNHSTEAARLTRLFEKPAVGIRKIVRTRRMQRIAMFSCHGQCAAIPDAGAHERQEDATLPHL